MTNLVQYPRPRFTYGPLQATTVADYADRSAVHEVDLLDMPTGTCTVCDKLRPLAKSQHVMPHQIHKSWCKGSGHLSRETLDGGHPATQRTMIDMNLESGKKERHLPETFDVEGCEVSPGPLGCLSCPLPVCRYDDPRMKRDAMYDAHAIDIVDTYVEALRSGHHHSDALAVAGSRWGITLTSVRVAIRRIRARFPAHQSSMRRSSHDAEKCGCAVLNVINAVSPAANLDAA